MKIYQQDIPGKQAKENIKAGVERHLAKLTESQRQELLGIAGNKAYTNGESWQKYLRSWQGIGKQESRVFEILLQLHADEKTDELCLDGRKTCLSFDKYGKIKITKGYDINAKYSPSNKSEPNSVIKYGSVDGHDKRQWNIQIFDEDGYALLSLHYGPHGNLKNHDYGIYVNGRKNGFHSHKWRLDNNGICKPLKHEEMPEWAIKQLEGD